MNDVTTISCPIIIDTLWYLTVKKRFHLNTMRPRIPLICGQNVRWRGFAHQAV
jgi:hypothetical protein